MELQRGSSCTFEEAIPVAKRLAKHNVFGSKNPVLSQDTLRTAGLAGVFEIEGSRTEWSGSARVFCPVEFMNSIR